MYQCTKVHTGTLNEVFTTRTDKCRFRSRGRRVRIQSQGEEEGKTMTFKRCRRQQVVSESATISGWLDLTGGEHLPSHPFLPQALLPTIQPTPTCLLTLYFYRFFLNVHGSPFRMFHLFSYVIRFWFCNFRFIVWAIL